MEINYSDSGSDNEAMDQSTDRSHLRKNKSFIIYLGLAAAYCVAFGLIFLHQFSRTSVFKMIIYSK